MAISRILSGQFLGRDDHLSLPDFSKSPTSFHSPRCDDTRGLIGPAALPLFCLAPHGVFRASRITPRAVSSYLAFSPLPALCCQRTGGVFSVTLSVAAVSQLQRPRILRGMPPYGVRTFLQQTPPTRDSPAIICHRREVYHNQESRKAGGSENPRHDFRSTFPEFLFS